MYSKYIPLVILVVVVIALFKRNEHLRFDYTEKELFKDLKKLKVKYTILNKKELEDKSTEIELSFNTPKDRDKAQTFLEKKKYKSVESYNK